MHEPIFDLTEYPAVLRELWDPSSPPPLDRGQTQEHRRLALHSVDWGQLQLGADPKMLDGCRAGLWLWWNFLDESHAISQQIDTPSGSYWHGMMHRREGDYSNAKYWFRQVSTHPVYNRLPAALATTFDVARMATLPSPLQVLAQQWDPYQFVDLCQRAVRSSDPAWIEPCVTIASIEWQLLFDYCWKSL